MLSKPVHSHLDNPHMLFVADAVAWGADSFHRDAEGEGRHGSRRPDCI